MRKNVATAAFSGRWWKDWKGGGFVHHFWTTAVSRLHILMLWTTYCGTSISVHTAAIKSVPEATLYLESVTARWLLFVSVPPDIQTPCPLLLERGSAKFIFPFFYKGKLTVEKKRVVLNTHMNKCVSCQPSLLTCTFLVFRLCCIVLWVALVWEQWKLRFVRHWHVNTDYFSTFSRLSSVKRPCLFLSQYIFIVSLSSSPKQQPSLTRSSL